MCQYSGFRQAKTIGNVRVKELRGESDPRLSTYQEEKKTGLIKAHVTQFIHWHQVELKGNEIQLKEDDEILQELENILDTDISTEQLEKKFTEYKRHVQHLLDRKSCLMENLKNRIAKELVDEQEI